MKTFFTKYRILIWVVLLLLVLNISVIGTIFYRNLRQSKVVTHPPVAMRMHNPAGPGVFMKHELALSEEQYTRFHEARMDYQKSVLEINNSINNLKRSYLHELMKNKPDEAIIRTTLDSVGIMHSRLMQETGNYYNQIRQFCSNDQVEKLNTFFLGAMKNEGNEMMRGRGMRGRMPNAERNVRNHKSK